MPFGGGDGLSPFFHRREARAFEVVEYRDLLIAIWQDPTPGLFTTRAWEEFGRSSPPVHVYLPFDDRRFVDYADRLGELSSRELQYVGARLFDALFQGDVLRLYVHLREQTRPAGARLRIRLRLEPPIVGRLPWECLYDTRHQCFLANSDETTVVRFQAQEREPAPAAVRPPVKVLLAGEAPQGEGSALAREARSVAGALRSIEAEGLIALQTVGRVLGAGPLTREALIERTRRDVDILHLVLDTRWESGRATYLLAGERQGSDPIDAEALSGILGAASPRLILLSGGEPAGATGPELALRFPGHQPSLVCLRGRLPEDLLERFSEALYRELTSLQPLDTALVLARAELGGVLPVESGWIPPAIFLGRRDARVFFNEARERVQRVYQLSEGRYRRRLREILNRIWPKPERYSRQMLRWMPRQEPVSAYLHAADFLGQPQSASEMSRRFQRLLLLGEPGAGKTMTLYRLFYEAAQPILSYRAKSPLPLYVALPDLPPGTTLFDYLAHGLDRELFLSDLAEGRFLFLLDAVDGLSAASTRRLSEAVNQFMRRFPMNRYVLTARGAIPLPLEVSSWVEILPFAEWEALDFLIDEDAMRAEPARLLYRQLSQALGARVGNPHVLAMARRLWREGARVPETLTGLYLAFFQVAGRSLAPELREELLPGLALYMTEMDQVSIHRRQLETDLPSAGRKTRLGGLLAGVGGSGAEVLLTELGKTRLLRGPRAFSFPSIAFQEFLAAYALRSREVGDLLELVEPAEWTAAPVPEERPFNLRRGVFHGAIGYLGGLRENPSELVQGLLSRDLVLAAECFREAGCPGEADEPVQEAIEAAIGSGQELAELVGCMALEARADLRAVGRLEALAAASDFPARSLAVEALGALRSHRSIPVLKAAALEKDPTVARAALGALARIKAS